MQNTTEFYCAYCGEASVAFVDLSSGKTQSYIEDCQVCCRPNVLQVQVDEDSLEITIHTEPES